MSLSQSAGSPSTKGKLTTIRSGMGWARSVSYTHLKITFVPMLIHIACFWVVGLFGGWWLAFRTASPMGVAGFWLGSLASLVLAAVLLGSVLWRAVRLVRD